MALTAGTRLGPFEIVAPIGAGGMGEVYQARDSRLQRDVAIKVLPEHLARDPEALARFEREARAVAGLSHPNILAIHDIGVEDGIAYSVTELLVGGTLRDRLGDAALPVRKVLDYGTQIAHGLAAAHDKGIVHRDLKPENIFITDDGRAKILDFGLAKVERGAQEDLTASPTVEVGTRPGTVMGTMGYMSPEQLRGQEVDVRSDLFSFGSILYEMLSGRRAFWRDTAADTMSAILKEDPPALSVSSPDVAPALERIVEHCLEKSPAERFQSARDLAFHLEAVGSASISGARTPIPAEAVRRRGLPRTLLFLAGLALGLAGGLIGARLLSKAPAAPPELRFLSYTGRESEPSAAPEGRMIAYTSTQGGRSRIWVKQLPGGDEAALTDGPDDRVPRISPDGSLVLFTRIEGAHSSLMRVPVVGGEPRKILDDTYDGDWSPDGSRVAYLRQRFVADRLEMSVGIVDGTGQGGRDITTVKLSSMWSPRWSPDGRTIAVAQGGTENSPNSILLVDVESGASRTLLPPPPAGRLSSLAWNEDGRSLLYSESESFVSSGVDEFSGRLLLQQIESGRGETLLSLPLSAQGVDILGPGRAVLGVSVHSQNLMEVEVIDGAASGTAHWLTRGNSTDRQPVFSPDGRWLLFSSNRDGNLDLWKVERQTGVIRRITEDEAGDWDPAFTFDGANILWSSNRGGHFEIWTCAADGTGSRQVTHDGADAENPTDTPDGRWIVYNSTNPAGSGIWKIRSDGSEATLLVPGSWSVPELSPDGRHVAFRSGAEPRKLLVARVDNGEIVAGPWPLPGNGNNGRVRWTPDGSRLVFTGSNQDGARGLFVQDFSPDRDTLSSRRQLLGFEEDLVPESFAFSPDGTRLIYSAADSVNSLMLAEGLPGVAPARRQSR